MNSGNDIQVELTSQTTLETPAVRSRRETNEYAVVSDTPQLVTVVGPAAGRTYFVRETQTVGRDPGCEIWLPDPCASRRHACITRSGDEIVLRDEGSRNGTRVNGRQVKEATIKTGDMIGLASTVLLLTYNAPSDNQLLQLQKMEAIGRLAGGVAHDFNNLLTSVISNARYLLDHEQLDGEGRACVEEILAAADRGTLLSQQLLDFARYEDPEHKPVDLSQLLGEVTLFCRKTFKKAIEVTAQIPEGLMITGDRTQLFQALMNVLINAEDAIPDSGRVELDARFLEGSQRIGLDPSRRYVEIMIADTGVGMSPGTLKRVFEPFFSSKPRGQSAGLGLTIALGILRRHRGFISAASTEDRGTRIVIHLPLSEAAEDAPRVRPRRRTREAAAVGARVLLIDDDELVRRTLARMLGAMGFQVTTAAGGAAGVAIFEEDPAAIVLLDMMMPGLGGAETFHILRKLNPEVKIIIISGYSDPDQLQQLLGKGACTFLRKPIDGARLREAIERAAQGK